ncbi:ATP-binding cassette domain-containing protein, partial [Mailhella sp.]|uniref:ATP-binding cassette domain-containing protein n=1 Tax=Mailhella sp. TaxID=1981029 RepID=UPI0040633E3A
MLILENIEKSFGETRVLSGVSLELAPAGITCLLGASGCGKSTLLRIAAGLERADAGTVHSRAEDCAMVFQDPRLLPWLSVGENLRLALSGLMPRREVSAAVERALAMVELPAATARALPRELSGGMAQRVGVARALLRKPRLMLMDEPFA